MLFFVEKMLKAFALQKFLHLIRRHVFVFGKSEYTDWCTAFMCGLDFDFFIRFGGIGCIRLANPNIGT